MAQLDLDELFSVRTVEVVEQVQADNLKLALRHVLDELRRSAEAQQAAGVDSLREALASVQGAQEATRGELAAVGAAQAAQRGGQSALEAELAQLKHELQRLDSLPEQLAAAQAENMVLQSRVALLEQRNAADASSAGKDEDGAGLTSLVNTMLQPVQYALDALAQDLLLLKAATPAPAPPELAPVAASGEAPAVTAASGGTVGQGAGHADLLETAAGAGRLGAWDAAGASSGVQPGTGSAETVTPAIAEPDLPALLEERGGWQTSPEGARGNAAGAAEQRSLQLALAPLHERLAAAEAALHGLAHEHSAAVGAELDALAQSVAGLQGRMAQQAAQLQALMDARSGPRVELSNAAGSETSAVAALPGAPAQGSMQDLAGSTQEATLGDAMVPRMGARRSYSGLQRITEGELLGDVSTATSSNNGGGAAHSEVTTSTLKSAAQPQVSLTSVEAGQALAPSTNIQGRMSSISPGPFAERLAELAASLEGLSTELQASKADQAGFQASVQQALAGMGADPTGTHRNSMLLAHLPEHAAASGTDSICDHRPASEGQESAAHEPLAQLQDMRSALGVLTSATHAMALRSRPKTAATHALARTPLHSARGSMGRRGSNITGVLQQEAPATAMQQAEPAAQAGDMSAPPADPPAPSAASALEELRAALAAGSIGHKLDSSTATAAASEGGTWQQEPFGAVQESRHLGNLADIYGARLADGDCAMLACRPLLGYRCMSCDRSLEGLDGYAGPHIPDAGFGSGGMEFTSANGVNPDKSHSPCRSMPRPHTSGSMGTDGLHGSGSERLRGKQSWYAEKHGPPYEARPRQEVGPRLPPGGWRAASHFSGKRASSMHGARLDDTPALRRARMLH